MSSVSTQYTKRMTIKTRTRRWCFSGYKFGYNVEVKYIIEIRWTHGLQKNSIQILMIWLWRMLLKIITVAFLVGELVTHNPSR